MIRKVNVVKHIPLTGHGEGLTRHPGDTLKTDRVLIDGEALVACLCFHSLVENVTSGEKQQGTEILAK